jgi:WD40 repeat protein
MVVESTTCISIMAIQPITNGDQAEPSTSHYRPTHTLQAHSRAVTALRYSSDGRTLVSGGADGWVHFWYILHFGHHRQTANPLGTVVHTNTYEALKHILRVSQAEKSNHHEC